MFTKNLQIVLLNYSPRKYKKFSKNFHILMYYILKKRNRFCFFLVDYKKFNKFLKNRFIKPHFSEKKKNNTLYTKRMVEKFNKFFFNYCFYFENNYKDYYFQYSINTNSMHITSNLTVYKFLIG
jgi:hypothetical protein